MSLKNCLDEAVRGGELDRGEADYLANRYEGYRKARENGGPDGAAEQARADLLEALTAEAAEKRRRAKLAAAHLQKFEADLKMWSGPDGKQHIGKAAMYKLEHNGEAPFSSVAGREQAIIGMAHARFEHGLNTFRRHAIAGDMRRHNKARLQNMVREAFGQDTKDPAAKELARNWAEISEWLRHRFNRAGGAIGKLENWGLPQHHDALALLKAGKQTWKETILPMLDIGRMRHPLTNRPVNSYELDAVLDDVWESIVTQGWNKRDPKRQPFGRGALAGQRAESRFLVFKDPDTWMEYQAAFGGGADPFATMMGHINGMARDIAALEILGPNPDATIEWLKQRIAKEANTHLSGKKARWQGDPQKAASQAASISRNIDIVWDSIRGTLNTPVNSRWANGLAAVRNLITSSVLGSAAVSAISDVGTQALARRFAFASDGSVMGDGMRAVGEIASMFKQANRREAVEAGLILDSAQHVFHGQARYAGNFNARSWTGFVTDRVLTLSGLTPWTQAGRHAFGMAFQNEIGKRIGDSFEKLPDVLQRTFRAYGITPDDWKQMQKASVHDREGVRMLRPAEIAATGDERLAERYLEMILTQTEFAVPSGTHRSRAILTQGTRPGTLAGELVRSIAMFKSFGVVMMFLHGGRAWRLYQENGARSAASYAGTLIASTALFGALALQLKQVVSGREPRDWRDPSFAGAAILQGGGLGIYGDFLFSDLNRYGGGLAMTLTGPVVQRANDLKNLTIGNMIQFASGEKTHFGRELVRFARGNVPGGNIWYLRAAWERMALDQVQKLVDPEADKAFKRQMQFWQREYGQEFFWKPGEALPAF